MNLLLWKNYLPIDASFEENLRKFEPDVEQALSSFHMLSEVFSDLPTGDYLHMIVMPWGTHRGEYKYLAHPLLQD